MEDFVNCLNYHCNMQMQTCTNEDSRVYGSKIYIAGNGENKIKVLQRTISGNVIIHVFGLKYPCKIEIQSCTNEDLEFYMVQALEVQNLIWTANRKMLKNDFLQNQFVKYY